MTTIVVKDGEIAADSQATRGDMIDTLKLTKLHRFNDFWIGLCGSLDVMQTLCLYLSEQMDDLPAELSCEGLILPDKGKPRTIMVSNGVLITTEVEDGYSVGSGSSYARAAMEAGASAKEAVKIATKFDVYSGGRILVKKRGDLK